MAEKNTNTKKSTTKSTANKPKQQNVAEEKTQSVEQQPKEIPNALAQPEEPANVHAQRSASDIAGDEVRGRWTKAKAVLYTDGLSGDAGGNLERAYEFNERLQSNDPAVRRAGDESLSESAKNARDSRDSREAQQVIDGRRVQQ